MAVTLLDQVDRRVAGLFQRVVRVVGERLLVPGEVAGIDRVGDMSRVTGEYGVTAAQWCRLVDRSSRNIAGYVGHGAVVTATAVHHRLGVPVFRQYQAHPDRGRARIDRGNFRRHFTIGTERLGRCASGRHRRGRGHTRARGRQGDGGRRYLLAGKFVAAGGKGGFGQGGREQDRGDPQQRREAAGAGDARCIHEGFLLLVVVLPAADTARRAHPAQEPCAGHRGNSQTHASHGRARRKPDKRSRPVCAPRGRRSGELLGVVGRAALLSEETDILGRIACPAGQRVRLPGHPINGGNARQKTSVRA